MILGFRDIMAGSRAMEVGGVVAVVAILALSVVSIVAVDLGASGVQSEGVPRFGHVFLILGENTEASTLNLSNAPYLLGSLRPMSAWFTNYFALTHHSEANYVGITSGQYTLCEQLDGAAEQCHQNVGNLFAQLDQANISWRAWMESMPSPCYLGDAGNLSLLNAFDGGHNPGVLYDNIEGAGGVWSATNPAAECLTHVVPAGTTGPNDMSAFDGALAAGSVPRFNLIVPNECESGEKACPASADRILQYDSFLRREVPRILSSPAFGSDGMLIVSFDEGTTIRLSFVDRTRGGGEVALGIISPLVQQGEYTGFANHYSLLRMLEDGFRLPAYLAGAGRATPLDLTWAP